MAVAKDARRATTVKTARTDPTAAGCENEFAFLMTAWKQPICVCVALEKIRRVADPSKSGIDKAIFGIPVTYWGPMGIVADPVTGVLAFRGQRLAEVRKLKPRRSDEAYVVKPAPHGSNVRLNRSSPSNEVLV